MAFGTHPIPAPIPSLKIEQPKRRVTCTWAAIQFDKNYRERAGSQPFIERIMFIDELRRRARANRDMLP